jgi:hypothetical protein
MITEPTTVGVGRTGIGWKSVVAVAALVAAIVVAVALVGPGRDDIPAVRAGAQGTDAALLHDYGLRHDYLPRSLPIIETSVDYMRHDYGLRHPPETDGQALLDELATSHDFGLREMARQASD